MSHTFFTSLFQTAIRDWVIKRRALFAVMMVISSAEPNAQSVVSGEDYLVDWKEMIGRIVSVGPCMLVIANDIVITCSVGRLLLSPGAIGIDASTMDRADLRRALKECTGFEEKRRCSVSFTSGTVQEKYPGQPMIVGAKLTWLAP